MAMVLLSAFGIHLLAHLNFWVCLGIALGGLLVNGIVAMIED